MSGPKSTPTPVPTAPAANQQTHPTLADRMKQYEASFDFTLPLAAPAILRLDGHTFSRFTGNFHKPFDQRIHDAMTATCVDLLKYFNQATVAYTQSDEITLVFPAGVQSFNERVQKLSSLAASYCSVRFNAHLAAFLVANPEPKVKEATYNALGSAHFDARFFTVPSVEEALNCLLWRCRGDAMRNSVNAFARSLYEDKQLHKKTVNEVLDMLRKEKGIEYEEAVPGWAVAGSKSLCLRHRNFVTNPTFSTLLTLYPRV
jgi:tRNA(His) guanylyltransferase